MSSHQYQKNRQSPSPQHPAKPVADHQELSVKNLGADEILYLQRTIGNQAVQRLVAPQKGSSPTQNGIPTLQRTLSTNMGAQDQLGRTKDRPALKPFGLAQNPSLQRCSCGKCAKCEAASQTEDLINETRLQRQPVLQRWFGDEEEDDGGGNWLDDTINTVTETVGGAWDTATGTAEDNWDGGSETTGETWDAGTDTEEVWDTVGDTEATDDGSGSILGGFSDTAGDAWDTVTGTASDVWDTVTDTASDVWDTVTDKADEGWEWVKDQWNSEEGEQESDEPELTQEEVNQAVSAEVAKYLTNYIGSEDDQVDSVGTELESYSEYDANEAKVATPDYSKLLPPGNEPCSPSQVFAWQKDVADLNNSISSLKTARSVIITKAKNSVSEAYVATRTKFIVAVLAALGATAIALKTGLLPAIAAAIAAAVTAGNYVIDYRAKRAEIIRNAKADLKVNATESMKLQNKMKPLQDVLKTCADRQSGTAQPPNQP